MYNMGRTKAVKPPKLSRIFHKPVALAQVATLISRRLTPAYRSRTGKWRMTDDTRTNERWTNIGNQAYPWPLKWTSWNTEISNWYRDILKYRYRIPNRLEKIPTKIPNTDTDVKYRHRPMTNRIYNTHSHAIRVNRGLPVVSLGCCDWLVAAGLRRPLQATSSCWLVGVNIIRKNVIGQWRKFANMDYGSRMIGSQRLRKAWAAFGCVEEDCVNDGQRIQFTLHKSHIFVIADFKMENCCT